MSGLSALLKCWITELMNYSNPGKKQYNQFLFSNP